jgi:hypothetical protein
MISKKREKYVIELIGFMPIISKINGRTKEIGK